MPGPPAKPMGEKRHTRAPRANTIKLPAVGRQGPAPKWPLSSFKPQDWDEIWKLPQAIMWERMHAELIVARYVELREKVSDSEFPESKSASFWQQLNNLEDRLGLTPMAMMKLYWEIEPTEDDAQVEVDTAVGVATVTRIDGVKDRLKKKKQG